MRPSLQELVNTARVVSLPMTTRFRGVEAREALLMRGPLGWTEFSPFTEYEDAEASVWLAGAIDFGWAVTAAEVSRVLEAFPGCRTAKVKVAEPGQTLAEDVARVEAVRRFLGPEGRIRLDANGAWTVDEAEHAIHAMAACDLEYVEQPCSSVEELAEIRKRVTYMDIPIAADESVRKAADPLAVARAGAANILVLKAQPLGGVAAALRIVSDAGLLTVISSALDTSVGISMGAHLAAAIPDLAFDCGLGTAALLASDVTEQPLLPVNGAIPVRRVEVSERLLEQNAASAERTQWWLTRLTRCHALL
jgi:O-succinylbenzoate synthase